MLYITDLPLDILQSFFLYLYNNELTSFIINQETKNIIQPELLERKKKHKYIYFVYIALLLHQKIRNLRFYEFCMINDEKEIIIKFLPKSIHNIPNTYRILIYYTIAGEQTIGDYHNNTKWINKNINTLLSHIKILVMNGYIFDDNCVLSRIPRFQGKYIL